MCNKVIITESQLRNIIRETIHSIILEGFHRSTFEVVGKTEPPSNISSLQGTNHLLNDRNGRLKNIKEKLGGFGDPIDSFIVDTKHPNGKEIHTICSNGIIIIQNQETKRLITTLIARPNQVTRYYDYLNAPKPPLINDVLTKCKEHQEQGFNNW